MKVLCDAVLVDLAASPSLRGFNPDDLIANGTRSFPGNLRWRAGS